MNREFQAWQVRSGATVYALHQHVITVRTHVIVLGDPA